MCKNERRDPPLINRCVSIYTSKKLWFHSKMSLINCLMDLEGGCKSTPNSKPPEFVEREMKSISMNFTNRVY